MDTPKRLSGRHVVFFYDAEAPLCSAVESGIKALDAEGGRLSPVILARNSSTPAALAGQLHSLIRSEQMEIVNMEKFCFKQYRHCADLFFLFTASPFLLFHLVHFYANNCLKTLLPDSSIPTVIALPPGTRDLSLNSVISPLFSLQRVLWVPFGWSLSNTNRYILTTRTDLWGESCFKAIDNLQIEPRYWEQCNHR